MRQLNYSIRKATEDDYFSVNSLLKESYKAYHQALSNTYKKIPDVIISYEIFNNTLKNQKSIILVAEVREIVVGVVDVSIEEGNGNNFIKPFLRGLIEELFVTNIYSNKGIEQALLQEVEHLVVKKNITQLITNIHSYDTERSNLLKNNQFVSLSVQYVKDIK